MTRAAESAALPTSASRRPHPAVKEEGGEQRDQADGGDAPGSSPPGPGRSRPAPSLRRPRNRTAEEDEPELEGCLDVAEADQRDPQRRGQQEHGRHQERAGWAGPGPPRRRAPPRGRGAARRRRRRPRSGRRGGASSPPSPARWRAAATRLRGSRLTGPLASGYRPELERVEQERVPVRGGLRGRPEEDVEVGLGGVEEQHGDGRRGHEGERQQGDRGPPEGGGDPPRQRPREPEGRAIGQPAAASGEDAARSGMPGSAAVRPVARNRTVKATRSRLRAPTPIRKPAE